MEGPPSVDDDRDDDTLLVVQFTVCCGTGDMSMSIGHNETMFAFFAQKLAPDWKN